jgi:uncharacterized repeat protein (TIGR01451 family)
MKIKIISMSIITILILSNAVILFGINSIAQDGQPQWPENSEWLLAEEDPNEAGCEDYKDGKLIYYHINSYYLYFRIEFYGYPNITEHDRRLKWFIDTDLPHNMGWQGNKVYDAEYLLFIEDSPKPHGDGHEDIYLIHDSDNDGFMNDEKKINGSGYEEYLISNTNIAGFNITGHYLDLYIRQENISSPEHIFFTWTTDQGDPNLDSSSAHDQSDFFWNADLSKADVSIEKSDSKDPVFTNESYSYLLKITNNGPHIAHHYNITDTQPDGITFTDTTPEPTEINGLEYRWYIPMINVSETKIIKINVTVKPEFYGTVINTANAINTYDPSPHDNSAFNETTILKIVGLNIEKTSEFDPPAHAGSLIVYTINVTNNGPDQASNINVTDTLPDGVTFLNASPDATEQMNDMQYRWYIPVLDVDESFIIKINVTVNESFYGVIVNTATIEYDDYDPDDGNEDNDTIIVLPIADISIIKTSEYDAPVYAGELVIYYLNITNHGPDVGYNVTITDILPNGVSYINSNIVPSSSNGQIYQWIIESLDVNESVIIRINITVNNGYSGTITNIASVTEESYDPNEENNQDEVTITVSTKSTGGGGGGGTGGHYTPPPEPFIDEKPTAIISGIYTGVQFEEIELDG